MDHLSVLIALQLFLDAILFSLLFLIYRRIKALDPERSGHILNALKEGERLCQVLEKNLEEKAALVKELKGYLDIQDQGANRNPDNPEADTRSEALKLHMQGLDIKEISRRTGLSQGEVEVVISLARARKEIS